MLESIFVLSPRGSCAGVSRAISAVEDALSTFGSPIYVLHEIVHNTYQIKRLASMGVIFVESITDIPKGSVVIFSAHGVPSNIIKLAKELELQCIDATCPLVANTHSLVKSFVQLGNKIVIIGQKKHAEVIGIAGCSDFKENSPFIVESKSDIDLLPISLKNSKLFYVTQSTLNVTFVDNIVNKLKAKFPNIKSCLKKSNNTICYATKNRQKIMELACKFVDFALVIGSKNSSNSQSLLKIATEKNIKAKLIDGIGDFNFSFIENVKKIAITAGASAPENLIDQIVFHIAEKYKDAKVLDLGEKENVNFKKVKIEAKNQMLLNIR